MKWNTEEKWREAQKKMQLLQTLWITGGKPRNYHEIVLT